MTFLKTEGLAVTTGTSPPLTASPTARFATSPAAVAGPHLIAVIAAAFGI